MTGVTPLVVSVVWAVVVVAAELDLVDSISVVLRRVERVKVVLSVVAGVVEDVARVVVIAVVDTGVFVGVVEGAMVLAVEATIVLDSMFV